MSPGRVDRKRLRSALSTDIRGKGLALSQRLKGVLASRISSCRDAQGGRQTGQETSISRVAC